MIFAVALILSLVLYCIDLLVFLGQKLEILNLNVYVLVLDEQVEHALDLFSEVRLQIYCLKLKYEVTVYRLR